QTEQTGPSHRPIFLPGKCGVPVELAIPVCEFVASREVSDLHDQGVVRERGLRVRPSRGRPLANDPGGTQPVHLGARKAEELTEYSSVVLTEPGGAAP